MNFINLFILLIASISFLELNAQKTSGKGRMIGLTASDINFDRYTNVIDNTSKYSILKNNSEIFEIVFKYDGDSILVYWIDRENITINSNTVKFSEGDKRVLISNYQVNVQTIDIDESATNLILFSTEKENQFITLYQFKPAPGSPFYFELPSMSENVRNNHKDAMVEYNKQQQTKKNRVAEIDKLRKEMRDYKDTIIKKCRQKEENEIRTSQAKADGELIAGFGPRMNSVFKTNFENLTLFGGNDSFNVSFVFICNERGMINVDTTTIGIHFKDGRVRSWFRDSFINYAKPEIESKTFGTTTKNLKNPDLLTDFEKEFKQRVEVVDPNSKENLFGAVIKELKDSLQLYSDYVIPIPVKYFYEIKVKSETKYPEWRYNGAGEIINKSEDFNQVEITEDLKQQFKTLNLKTGSRYTVEHCTVSINDQKFSPHIRETKPKPF